MIRRAGAVLLALTLLSACSGGDDGADGGAPTPGSAAPELAGQLSWSRAFVTAGDPATSGDDVVRTEVLGSTAEGLLVVSGPTAAFSTVSVVLVDPSDGDTVWSQNVTVGLRSDVVGLVDDVVVVVERESGSEIDTIRGFDLVDGGNRWSMEGTAITVSLVDGLIAVGSSDGTTALEPSTGVIVWSDPLRTPVGPVPAGLLSARVVPGDQPSLALVDTATGEARWTLDVSEAAVSELRAMLSAAVAGSLEAPEVLPLVGADGSMRALDASGTLSAPLPLGLPVAGADVVELIAVGHPDEVVVCTGNEDLIRLVGVELGVPPEAPTVLFDREIPAFQVSATSFTPRIADVGTRRIVTTGGDRRPCQPDASDGFGGLAAVDVQTGSVSSTVEAVDRVVLDIQPSGPGLNPSVSSLATYRETDPDSGEVSWALLDLVTDQTRWRVVDAGPARTMTIVAGSVLVFEAETTTLGALDPVDGSLLWALPLAEVEPAGERTAAADAERVYLGFGDRLVAVD